ncbi:hypothetical protein [Devosia sp. 66-22]|uniref:hypothetical protein n=1 Tax=Devosia sp. 66-22 TaxID=1895753 RepID=UPI0009286E58|nr:hypothetical protein [Devosia sp. 66-22]OJX50402.1 MAG: hypothetical protein BGO81_04810 [Devosia sp. 66-22]
MRAQAVWIIFIGTVIAVAAAVVAIIGFVESNVTLGIIAVVAAVAAVVGTVLLYRRSGATGRPAFEQALSADFAAAQQGWFHASGLAIDPTRRLLLVGTESGATRIPLSDISSVVYHRTQNTPAYGGNSILALIMLPAVIGSMVHNASKAGLHVTAGGRSYRIIGIQPKDAEVWQGRLADGAA